MLPLLLGPDADEFVEKAENETHKWEFSVNDVRGVPEVLLGGDPAIGSKFDMGYAVNLPPFAKELVADNPADKTEAFVAEDRGYFDLHLFDLTEKVLEDGANLIGALAVVNRIAEFCVVGVVGRDLVENLGAQDSEEGGEALERSGFHGGSMNGMWPGQTDYGADKTRACGPFLRLKQAVS